VTSDQPVPERKVGEGEREQGENVDHVSAILTPAHGHLNATAVSLVLRMIRLAPERIKANSRMILPTPYKAYHLMIALVPTQIAKTIETSGNN